MEFDLKIINRVSIFQDFHEHFIINRVRVSRSGRHAPTQTYVQSPPPPSGGSKKKEAEKVALIKPKAHVGSLLFNSIERHQPPQPPQPPLRNREQRASSSSSELETNSENDVVERVVGSSSAILSDESSPETDLPAPYQEPLQTSKYGRKRARVERDDYFSWENIVS